MNGLFLFLLTVYPWPLPSSGVPYPVTGVFGEYRPGPPPHFHDGTDLAAADGTPVLAVQAGTVLGVGSDWIRVGRFAYVHVVPDPFLGVGDVVQVGDTIAVIQSGYGHVHFKDGGGAYSTWTRNALDSLDGLSPYTDPHGVRIHRIRFFRNDDPGTLLDSQAVWGAVDVEAYATDSSGLHVYPTTINNGIYRIGWALYTADTSRVLRPFSIRFTFDTLVQGMLGQASVSTVYAPWSSAQAHFYWITHSEQGNGALNTDTLTPGPYLLQVVAWDIRNHADTAWVSFQVIPPPAPPQDLRAWLLPDGRAAVYVSPSPSTLLLEIAWMLPGDTAWSPWNVRDTLPPGTSADTLSPALPEGWTFAFRLRIPGGTASPRVFLRRDTGFPVAVRTTPTLPETTRDLIAMAFHHTGIPLSSWGGRHDTVDAQVRWWLVLDHDSSTWSIDLLNRLAQHVVPVLITGNDWARRQPDLSPLWIAYAGEDTTDSLLPGPDRAFPATALRSGTRGDQLQGGTWTWWTYGDGTSAVIRRGIHVFSGVAFQDLLLPEARDSLLYTWWRIPIGVNASPHPPSPSPVLQLTYRGGVLQLRARRSLQLEIRDILGRRVRTFLLLPGKEQRLHIPAGIYWIVPRTGGASLRVLIP